MEKMKKKGLHAKELLTALQIDKRLSGKKKADLKVLLTPWGEQLDPQKVLQEYPRPQLVRNYGDSSLSAENRSENGEIRSYHGEGYCNLNGYWHYAFSQESDYPRQWDGKILVPFSPESYLSGVGRRLSPNEFLWYEKTVMMEEPLPAGSRLLLHFGAVDQECTVWVNDEEVCRHTGGYLPFTAEVTDVWKTGENRVVLRVTDDTDTGFHSRGKQSQKPGGMFYTPQSGIWQTVWLERVPEVYIKELKITPLYDRQSVRVRVILNEDKKKASMTSEISVEIWDAGQQISGDVLPVGRNQIVLPVPEMKEWTPEQPHLYDLVVRTPKDEVKSYFAMRCVSVEQDTQGIPRLYLNHKPYFQKGVLDQGYWPDGLMTPPDDAALVYDIMQMKEAGFCMIRKHCQIAPLRFYYHCDRLGMLVWQDMVNGGEAYNTVHVTYIPTLSRRYGIQKDGGSQKNYRKMARGSLQSRMEWKRECMATVHLLYNSPCVVTWVLFNEGWGQFDALEAAEQVRQMDSNRLIDHASGWFDQGGGDMRSVHCYFRKLQVEKPKAGDSRRAFVISEYGGHAFHVEGHCATDYVYGYHVHKTPEAFQQAFIRLQEEMEELIPQGLAASVYTQVSDIEEEVNGLLTYDRKVNKLNL